MFGVRFTTARTDEPMFSRNASMLVHSPLPHLLRDLRLLDGVDSSTGCLQGSHLVTRAEVSHDDVEVMKGCTMQIGRLWS